MASIKFYINKDKAKWTEEETLYAKFTHCFGTGDYRSLKIFQDDPIRLDPNKWDVKAQRVIGKSSAAMKIQQRVNEEYTRILNAWAQLDSPNSYPTLDDLKGLLKGDKGAVSTRSYNTLIDLIHLYVEDKRLSFAKNTVWFYECALVNVLKAFQEETSQSLIIEHIDLTFFNKFKTYNAGREVKNQSTNNYLGKIRAVLRYHKENGAEGISSRINLDYLRVKKLPTSQKGERDHISEDEAVFLFSLNLSAKYSLVRDLYLFMVFTGPRFNDAINMRVEANIRALDNSLRVLSFTQQKTKGVEQVVVPLNHICEEIIRRNNPSDSGLIFKFRGNSGFNDSLRCIFRRLKEFHTHATAHDIDFLASEYEQSPKDVRRVARWLGLHEYTPDMRSHLSRSLKTIEGLLKKRESVDYVGAERVSETYERWEKLSAHTGRHSFASLLADKGATLKETQKMLGHRNSRTTEKYFHIDQEKTVQKVSDMLAVPLMKAM